MKKSKSFQIGEVIMCHPTNIIQPTQNFSISKDFKGRVFTISRAGWNNIVSRWEFYLKEMPKEDFFFVDSEIVSPWKLKKD